MFEDLQQHFFLLKFLLWPCFDIACLDYSESLVQQNRKNYLSEKVDQKHRHDASINK